MRDKEFKSLTIRYFIEQKCVEITKFVGYTALIIVIPYLIGQIMNTFLLHESSNVTPFVFGMFLWTIGVIGLLGIALVVMIIFVIYKELVKWIKSNWKLAKERAKEDLKEKKRK